MSGRLPPISITEPQMSHPRVEVGSSAVSHIGYDSETATLYVTARKTSMTHLYLGVPLNVFEAFAAAASIGVAWNRDIKPRYECIAEGYF